MEHEAYHNASFYAPIWKVSRETARKWIIEFNYEIEKFNEVWYLENELKKARQQHLSLKQNKSVKKVPCNICNSQIAPKKQNKNTSKAYKIGSFKSINGKVDSTICNNHLAQYIIIYDDSAPKNLK